jgi:putative flippase GtrA
VGAAWAGLVPSVGVSVEESTPESGSGVEGVGGAASASASPAGPATVPAAAPEKLGLKAQLVRFVVIGALAAVVDLGVYQLLLALGVWAPLAKGVSFILGTTTAYLLNRRFTFAASKGGSGRFLGFVILYGSTFAANVAVASLVLWLLHAPSVGTPPLPGFIAWFVAQAVATSINFVVMRTVIFKD